MSTESHDLGSVPNLTALTGYGDSYVVPGDEVYVVAEDCDYIYRNPGTNPVADGFNIVDAIFLPGYWERRSGSSGSAGLRFNTVAIGASGSGRLIDVGLSGLVDGVSTAWVESVKDTWRWDATSTLTADNITVCNPTANGANPGRFIRKLEPAPEWRQQAAWFVDTAGNDENDGTTSLTPVKTDVEISRRWGSGTVQLSVPVTVTYAQAPAGDTAFDWEPLTGGSLTLLGTPTISQAAVVLTAVTAQNRGTQTAWAITGATLGAADVNKIAIITAGTAGNIGAYARVLKDNGGGSVNVSPFGKFAVGSSPFTQVTPVVGDTVQIVTPMTLNCAMLRTTSNTTTAAAASPTRNCLVVDSITLTGTASFQGMVISNGAPVFFARSIPTNVAIAGSPSSVSNVHFCGGGAHGVTIQTAGVAQFRQTGITSFLGLLTGARAVLFTDTYFQNADCTVDPAASILSTGAAWFDRASSDRALQLFHNAFYRQSGAVPDWGSANAGHGILVSAGAMYSYTTKPTVNTGLGAGREVQLGGVDTLYAGIPAVTAANNAAMVVFA